MLDSGLLISWAECSHDRQEEVLLRLFSKVIGYSDELLEGVASAASGRSCSGVMGVSAVSVAS